MTKGMEIYILLGLFILAQATSAFSEQKNYDAEEFWKSDAYLIKNASLANKNAGGDGYASHRLQKGNEVVIAIRESNEGDPHARDDESYRKITIILPSFATGSYDFGSGAHAIATLGSSAWNLACGAVLKSGKLEIKSADIISIDTEFVCKRPGNKTEKIKLKKTYKLSALPFDQLTPWIGLEGNHRYRETYPDPKSGGLFANTDRNQVKLREIPKEILGECTDSNGKVLDKDDNYASDSEVPRLARACKKNDVFVISCVKPSLLILSEYTFTNSKWRKNKKNPDSVRFEEICN
jgi:hypothetical protein